jgi:hypothetical protein
MKGTIERLPSGRYRARKKTKRCGQYVALGTFGTEEEAKAALEQPTRVKASVLSLSKHGGDAPGPRGRRGKPVSLYVVSVPGFAKVGHASDLQRRLRNYQCENPLVDAFDATFDGDEVDEAAVHCLLARRFARKGRTEWFVGATAADAIACVKRHFAEQRRAHAADERARRSERRAASRRRREHSLGTLHARLHRPRCIGGLGLVKDCDDGKTHLACLGGSRQRSPWPWPSKEDGELNDADVKRAARCAANGNDWPIRAELRAMDRRAA